MAIEMAFSDGLKEGEGSGGKGLFGYSSREFGNCYQRENGKQVMDPMNERARKFEGSVQGVARLLLVSCL